MLKLVKVVAPGSAHRITQRGNRRWLVFFSDALCFFYYGWAPFTGHSPIYWTKPGLKGSKNSNYVSYTPN